MASENEQSSFFIFSKTEIKMNSILCRNRAILSISLQTIKKNANSQRISVFFYILTFPLLVETFFVSFVDISKILSKFA